MGKASCYLEVKSIVFLQLLGNTSAFSILVLSNTPMTLCLFLIWYNRKQVLCPMGNEENLSNLFCHFNNQNFLTSVCRLSLSILLSFG